VRVNTELFILTYVGTHSYH